MQSKKAPEGLKALAIYQWKARQDNHLSFNKDDVVAIMEQEDMWWMGEMNGKVSRPYLLTPTHFNFFFLSVSVPPQNP